MKVLLRRPVATQSSGSDGLTADNEDTEDTEGGEGQGRGGAEGEGGEQGDWGVGVEKGVWDEPIIKRWEDGKVGEDVASCFPLL